MPELRVPDESFPEIDSRLLTLIRVDATASQFAVGVGDKRELLSRPDKRSTRYVVVWKGEWECHAFQVSKELVKTWRKTLNVVLPKKVKVRTEPVIL